MSVFLYNPVSSAGRKPVLPMSILSLGALLEEKVGYRIFDGNLLDDPLEQLSRAITEEDARILAVTVMPGPQLGDVTPICQELKKRFPSLIIVWGGYFPSQHPEVCIRADFVDYVVRGHGEKVFAELVQSLLAGETVENAPGLAFDESSASTSGVAPITDPDRLPDFPYHRIDMERYVRKTFLGSRTMSHHSSNGCPFFCNFCAVVNMVNGGWKAQSAERVASIVDHLVDTWGANAVEFWDNNFFVHQERTKEFSERILRHGISWWGEGRIDTMLKYSDRTWDLMSRSGLRMVFLGAESGSDETLKRMRKGGTATTEKTLEIVDKMRRFGVIPELSFVLGNPPDPEGDVTDTLEFVRKVKKIHPESEIILYLYTPVPLSGELYERAKASGFTFPETLDGWLDSSWQDVVQRRSSRLPWIGDSVHRKVRDFERVLNAYYPTTTDASLGGMKRGLLRWLSAWRWHTRSYSYPYELAAFHRLFRYQRPETAGF